MGSAPLPWQRSRRARRPGAGVSTPVAWEEIDEDIRGTHFNLHNVPGRVAKQRKDPWAGYWTKQQGLTTRPRSACRSQ